MREISDEELYRNMLIFRDQRGKLALSEATFRETDLYKEVRRRAKADLFFLSKYFIGFMDEETGVDAENKMILDRVHRRICDAFVHKMDDKPVSKQDERKQRMILYPRGTLKSHLDGIDALQWILNFPNIRILFMTADEELAERFLKELKSRFTIKDQPSFMNTYFPEFCIEDTKTGQGNVNTFITPMRTNKDIKEPTVLSSSIGSTLSGNHFDVIKSDDIISNNNSSNEEVLRKVTKHFYINKKTLMAWGYLDIIGTRYHDSDLYGGILEKNVGNITKVKDETGAFPLWECIENNDTGLQIVIGRAIVPKQGVFKEIKDLEEEESILLFPEYLTFKFLKQEWNTDEAVSEGQYNQNPHTASETTFDLALLQRQTVDFQKIPYSGPTTVTWDFAFSRKKGRDYSTCAVARWNEKGEMYVIELVRGQFSPSALSKAVVESVSKWRPVVCGIEDAGGSRFLEDIIIAEAKKTGQQEVVDTCAKIDWFKPDLQKDAKKNRMRALHPWMVDNRLFFAKHLDYLEVLYSEFMKCLVTTHHDDIPDVISQQVRYAPRMIGLAEKKELFTFSMEDANWNLLFEENCDAFGRVGTAVPQTNFVPVPEERGPGAESAYDADPILGSGLFG